MKYILKALTDNTLAFNEAMAWRLTSDKPVKRRHMVSLGYYNIKDLRRIQTKYNLRGRFNKEKAK